MSWQNLAARSRIKPSRSIITGIPDPTLIDLASYSASGSMTQQFVHCTGRETLAPCQQERSSNAKNHFLRINTRSLSSCFASTGNAKQDRPKRWPNINCRISIVAITLRVPLFRTVAGHSVAVIPVDYSTGNKRARRARRLSIFHSLSA